MIDPKLSQILDEVAERFGKNHFSHTLGIEMLLANNGRCIVRLPVRPDHLQNAGFVHGGILATLADVAMGFAASSAVGEDRHVLTGELKISYLNPAIHPLMEARGTVLKAGRKIVFTEGEIWGCDASGQALSLVAKSSSSMVVVTKEDLKPKAK